MPIIRAKHKENFTQILNEVLVNRNLSYGAKGLMAYVLTHYDKWSFAGENYFVTEKDKLSKIKGYLKELKDYGYLKRYQEKASNGSFGKVVYIFYESPITSIKKSEEDSELKISKEIERANTLEETKRSNLSQETSKLSTSNEIKGLNSSKEIKEVVTKSEEVKKLNETREIEESSTSEENDRLTISKETLQEAVSKKKYPTAEKTNTEKLKLESSKKLENTLKNSLEISLKEEGLREKALGQNPIGVEVKKRLSEKLLAENQVVDETNQKSRVIPKIDFLTSEESITALPIAEKSICNNIKLNNTDINKKIYSHWNSKKIIVHKILTKYMEKAIENALKIYSQAEIMQAIDIYDEILESEFYFNYRWNLMDFLNRKNGISTFMDEGSNKVNYKTWKKEREKSANTSRSTKWDRGVFNENSQKIRIELPKRQFTHYTNDELAAFGIE